jgi:hypothetical protein
MKGRILILLTILTLVLCGLPQFADNSTPPASPAPPDSFDPPRAIAVPASPLDFDTTWATHEQPTSPLPAADDPQQESPLLQPPWVRDDVSGLSPPAGFYPSPGPAAAVPEPTSFVFAAMALLSTALYRRNVRRRQMRR